MEEEKYHNLPLASWRPQNSDDIIQYKPKGRK
jgi:hypothetical protein